MTPVKAIVTKAYAKFIARVKYHDLMLMESIGIFDMELTLEELERNYQGAFREQLLSNVKMDTFKPGNTPSVRRKSDDALIEFFDGSIHTIWHVNDQVVRTCMDVHDCYIRDRTVKENGVTIDSTIANSSGAKRHSIVDKEGSYGPYARTTVDIEKSPSGLVTTTTSKFIQGEPAGEIVTTRFPIHDGHIVEVEKGKREQTYSLYHSSGIRMAKFTDTIKITNEVRTIQGRPLIVHNEHQGRDTSYLYQLGIGLSSGNTIVTKMTSVAAGNDRVVLWEEK